MTDAGKFMILAGALVALLGAVVWALGKAGFHGLPGDIHYEGSIRASISPSSPASPRPSC